MAICGNKYPEQGLKGVEEAFCDIDVCSTIHLSIILKIQQPST